ncbi:hypothetical protein TCAL_06331 [Tigriopus californicus]|uniref:Uncharacterized protein n=1 Tax=Tigriopus californicus TaxID=6832 RepID=A0A553PAQ8_TIGCA|nr:uncharacterized protein LOC131892880 [Tigriopus californicus]TRY74754.1 hypothetical protein TCAL_06331 [Tigriopus californicus]
MEILWLFFALLISSVTGEGEKLIVIGGQGPDVNEVVDLFTDSLYENCTEIQRYPIGFVGGSALKNSDGLLFCGGQANYKECFRYDVNDENSWSLLNFGTIQHRVYSASAPYSADGWWITGGYHDQNSSLLSTEILQSGSFVPGPNLPTPLYQHCLVRIDETRYFLTGGLPYSTSAWIFDTNTQVWEEVANPSVLRKSPYCGLSKTFNGEFQIVVSGGFDGMTPLDSVEIFSVSDQSWRFGPSLPQPMGRGATSSYGDTFILVGGYGDGGYVKDLYQYEPDSGTWATLPQKLQKGRSRHVALVVDVKDLNCTQPLA